MVLRQERERMTEPERRPTTASAPKDSVRLAGCVVVPMRIEPSHRVLEARADAFREACSFIHILTHSRCPPERAQKRSIRVEGVDPDKVFDIWLVGAKQRRARARLWQRRKMARQSFCILEHLGITRLLVLPNERNSWSHVVRPEWVGMNKPPQIKPRVCPIAIFRVSGRLAGDHKRLNRDRLAPIPHKVRRS